MKKNNVVSIIFVVDRFEETWDKWVKLQSLIPVDIFDKVNRLEINEGLIGFELNNPDKTSEIFLTKFLTRETDILGKGGIFEEETE